MDIHVELRGQEPGWIVKFSDGDWSTIRYIVPRDNQFWAVNPYDWPLSSICCDSYDQALDTATKMAAIQRERVL